MKNLLLLISLVSLLACNTKTIPDKKPLAIPQTSTNVSSFVNVTKYTGFNKSEVKKSKKYIPVMDNTIKSKCFEDFMVKRKMHTTQGRTNLEVVNHIRTSTVNIELITYYKRFSKVHGYTYPNVNKIWLNRKYHSGASLCSEASNLAHELSHKIGYGHDYKATQIRPYSVPYSINAAFKACCN